MQTQRSALPRAMISLPSLLLLLLTTTAQHHVRTATAASVGAQIYPSGRIVVQSGQGFLVKLTTDRGFGQVKYCTFLFNGEPYFLHPGNENEMQYVSVHGETVQRFTENECGVKVSNVSLYSAGNWQLGATSITGKDASAEFTLKVLPSDEEPTERIIYGRPGTQVVVNCSRGDTEPDLLDDDEGYSPNRRFCEMWSTTDEDLVNPRRMESESKAIMEEKPCQWNSTFPELMGRTEVYCRTFDRGAMEMVMRKWRLVGEYLKTTTDYLNGDKSMVLRCRSKSPLSSCYIQHRPTGRMYQVANALNGHRYSSFRSNLRLGHCQFEIPKPFLADDLGIWLMTMFKGGRGEEDGVEECLFTVSDGQVFQV